MSTLSSHRRSSGCGAPPRVLVVDDHEDTRTLVAYVLERAGYDVVTADDGEQALAKLVSERFDVAVVDIALPGLDGWEVVRRARARIGDELPVLIAMTAYGRDHEREASRAAGFMLHLLKPVDPETLVEAIRGAAGESMAS